MGDKGDKKKRKRDKSNNSEGSEFKKRKKDKKKDKKQKHYGKGTDYKSREFIEEGSTSSENDEGQGESDHRPNPAPLEDVNDPGLSPPRSAPTPPLPHSPASPSDSLSVSNSQSSHSSVSIPTTSDISTAGSKALIPYACRNLNAEFEALANGGNDATDDGVGHVPIPHGGNDAADDGTGQVAVPHGGNDAADDGLEEEEENADPIPQPVPEGVLLILGLEHKWPIIEEIREKHKKEGTNRPNFLLMVIYFE